MGHDSDAAGESDSLSRQDKADLLGLKWHWDGAYRVSADEHGWSAARVDNGETLTAESAGELEVAIRTDYARCPVPRSEEAR